VHVPRQPRRHARRGSPARTRPYDSRRHPVGADPMAGRGRVMRIVKAEVIHLRQDEGYGTPDDGAESHGVPNVALVRLETDDGIVGWADVETAPTVARAAMDAPDQPFFRGIRHTILGQNPLEVDRLWSAMYRDTVYYGKEGVAIQVMSGVINACFDIIGKAFGQPLSLILGGRN